MKNPKIARIRRWLIFILIFATIAGTTVYQVFLKDRREEVKVAMALHGEISSKLYVKAQINPGKIISQTPEIKQKVTSVLVNKGDQVNAGDVLFTLDKEEIDTLYAKAKSERVKLQKEKADKASEEAKTLAERKKQQDALNKSTEEFSTALGNIITAIQPLLTQNPDSETPQVDTEQLNKDIQTIADTLPAILSSATGSATASLSGSVDLASQLSPVLGSLGLKTTDPLVEAIANEAKLKLMSERAVTEVKALSSGLIAELNVKVGDYTGSVSYSDNSGNTQIAGIDLSALSSLTNGVGSQQQASAVVIYDNTQPKALFKVSQYDSSRILKDLPVVYTYSGKTYSGTVASVSKFVDNAKFGATSENSILNSIGISSSVSSEPQLTVEMNIIGENLTELVPGFLIDAEIITAKAENVLLIPAESMKRELDKYYVFVVDDDGLVIKKEFLPGIQSDMFVQVKSGLSDGDKVILNPTKTITNGVRVKYAP